MSLRRKLNALDQDWVLIGVLVIGVIALPGCGSKPADEPTLAEVTGKVMLDGAPAKGGNIFFTPDESKGTKGPASLGVINDKGEFTLSSSGGRGGAVVGHHKVNIVCPQAGSSEGATGSGPPPCNIPKKYESPDSSDLVAEIKAGQPNEVTLQLSSK